jgi:hypothetical protein
MDYIRRTKKSFKLGGSVHESIRSSITQTQWQVRDQNDDTTLTELINTLKA